jgi:hypothetical protein
MIELEYVFLGIETSDGAHPRLKVRVRATEASTSMNVAGPRIDITLPLSPEDSEASYQSIVARALRAAREAIDGKRLLGWAEQAAAQTSAPESAWTRLGLEPMAR